MQHKRPLFNHVFTALLTAADGVGVAGTWFHKNLIFCRVCLFWNWSSYSLLPLLKYRKYNMMLSWVNIKIVRPYNSTPIYCGSVRTLKIFQIQHISLYPNKAKDCCLLFLCCVVRCVSVYKKYICFSMHHLNKN